MKNHLRHLIAGMLKITPGELSILHAGSGTIVYRTDGDKLRNLMGRLHPVEDKRLPLIRVGPTAGTGGYLMGDGGYLVPDDLNGIAACFSPGVSSESGFEKHCAERGMDIFMADKSVDGPAEAHDRFPFVRTFVGASTHGDYITLDDWVASSLPESASELLLQMDIEGAEYETLLRASDSLLGRFRIIIIEFHGLEQLWSRPFFGFASSTFEKLLQTHRCVHIHPNNCSDVSRKEGIEIPSAMEFTFLRRDRFSTYAPATVFPHPLDADCAARPPLPLPACWYEGGQTGRDA